MVLYIYTTPPIQFAQIKSILQCNFYEENYIFHCSFPNEFYVFNFVSSNLLLGGGCLEKCDAREADYLMIFFAIYNWNIPTKSITLFNHMNYAFTVVILVYLTLFYQLSPIVLYVEDVVEF